jgi:ATP-dependent helicase/nuclease subunit A
MSNTEHTAEQRSAIDAPGSVVVRAGAGSGKTRVLTERYVRAIGAGLKPHEIVAMAFTDRAAAEMRQRIRERVARMDKDPSEIAALLEQLADAPIGTIHGFCTRILHELPVEAGVDPAFEVADESRSWQLRRQAVDAAIADAADDPKHPARPNLDTLLSYYTRRQLAEMLAELLDKKRYFPDETSRRLSLQPRDMVTDWQRLFSDETAAVTRGIAANATVRSLVEQLASLADGCANPDDKLFATLAAVLDAFAGLRADPARHAVAAAAALADQLLRNDGRPRAFGNIGSAQLWPDVSAKKAAQGALGELAQHMTPLKALRKMELDETDVLIARIVHSLWRLIGEVERQYDIIKGTGRILDFDDLESATIALLESERGKLIVRTLRARYRLILVDECQDLNLLQFRLIELLLGPRPAKDTADVFAVGDPQQSIFAFRNADVRLFDAIADKLLPPGASRCPLGDNFRSTPGLVAFANSLFKQVMPGGEEFDVAYGTMRAHRAPLFESSTELLLPAAPDAEAEDGDERDPCAAAIAERIVALVENGPEHVPDDPKGAEARIRPPTYGDIAVLLRTRSALPALLDALRARSVPHAVYKGIGFYQTQEVRDVFTCFRFLADPTRDLDLAGTLRAPFFSLSDDGLFLLTHGRGEASLYDELLSPRRLDELSAEDRQAVARAQKLIPAWLAMVDLVKPSLLLGRILDDTGAWGTYSAIGAAANLGKLLRVLRRFQASGASLAQTVDVLDECIHNVTREGTELNEALSDDTVKIMTIHAAKGLEFPIVFLVGLADNLARAGQPSALQVDPDIGFALDTPPALRRTRSGGAIHELIAERVKRKELAEARRLLYVACTRARDHLFLVGCGDKPRTQSWQQWIAEALGFSDGFPDDGASRTVELGDGATLRIVRATPSPAPSVPRRKPLPVKEPPPGADEGTLDVGLLARAVAPIPADRHDRTFSVTELVDFAQCPRLYCMRHVLGVALEERPMLPDDTLDAFPDVEDGDPDRRSLGRLLHRLLERLAADAPMDLHQAALDAARHETLDDANGQHLAQHAERIAREFRESELGTALLESSGSSELAFALRLDNGIVRGRVDRLLDGPPPLVVDFKLPARPEQATRDLLELSYGIQLRAYALAVSRLLGAERVRTAIVLPETGASFEWEYGADDWAQIEHELVERIAAITTADADDLLRSGPGCGHCIACRTMSAAPTRA